MRFISDLLSIYRLVGIRITCCWVDKTNFPRSHDNTSSAVGCAVSYTHTDLSRIPKRETTMHIIKLITHRKGKVIFSQVFVCPQSASSLIDHCSSLLRHGRYASTWNTFLYGKCFAEKTASCHVKNHWRIWRGHMDGCPPWPNFLCFHAVFVNTEPNNKLAPCSGKY